MEESSNIGFTRLITLYGSDPVMSLLVLKRSANIDWGLYVGDELPFLRYDLETGTVFDIVATRASNCLKVVGGKGLS